MCNRDAAVRYIQSSHLPLCTDERLFMEDAANLHYELCDWWRMHSRSGSGVRRRYLVGTNRDCNRKLRAFLICRLADTFFLRQCFYSLSWRYIPEHSIICSSDGTCISSKLLLIFRLQIQLKVPHVPNQIGRLTSWMDMGVVKRRTCVSLQQRANYIQA